MNITNRAEVKTATNQALIDELEKRERKKFCCAKAFRSCPKEGKESKIVKVFTRENKLFIQLADEREVGIPISWWEKWGIENVTAEKLQEYEIWKDNMIFFPQIDEILGREKFLHGFKAPFRCYWWINYYNNKYNKVK